MTTISVVTPWLAHPELLPDYARSVERADEVIVVDNGSPEPPEFPVRFTVIRLEENRWFTAACNRGLAEASGDVVLMLNNDVRAEPDWLEAVRSDVRPGGFYGPGVQHKAMPGLTGPMPYVEGWCVAAARETWLALGGWDQVAYPHPYWEDVDLSFRAITAGMGLYRCPWQIEHLSNTTSASTPGAYDHSAANGETFAARVAAYLQRRADAEAAPAA